MVRPVKSSQEVIIFADKKCSSGLQYISDASCMLFPSAFLLFFIHVQSMQQNTRGIKRLFITVIIGMWNHFR